MSTGSWYPRDFSAFQVSSSYKSYLSTGCGSRAIWFSGMSISKKSKQLMRFYTDSSSFVINLFHVLFMQFMFCFLCHSFVRKFLHHCSFVIFVFMLVLILLLATRLLKLRFKKQIFNYYGVFWFYDDVKWFCSYANKCHSIAVKYWAFTRMVYCYLHEIEHQFSLQKQMVLKYIYQLCDTLFKVSCPPGKKESFWCCSFY